MNRRKFLKTLAATGASAFIPVGLINAFVPKKEKLPSLGYHKDAFVIDLPREEELIKPQYLEIDDFRERFLRPAMKRLADDVEKDTVRSISSQCYKIQ